MWAWAKRASPRIASAFAGPYWRRNKMFLKTLSLFDDYSFEDTCDMIQGRNEAKAIQDVAELIVPRAQRLTARGAKHFNCLIESVHEGWNNPIPLLGPRPQPNYAVGFKRLASTEDQLSKIKPILGNVMDMSFFIIIYYSRAQDHPESKQILAKLAGKNQHLRKTNISEVGSLCSVKSMGYNMYRGKIHRWTEWPRGQSEYKIIMLSTC
jgi:hypothetical protein